MVRNGSILTNSDCNSPLTLRKYDECFPKEVSEAPSAKVQKVRTMIGPGTKLAFSKQPTENTLVSTEACYRHGRTIRAIYVNLETGSYGSNKIGPTHT
jgi:hypothetical protein